MSGEHGKEVGAETGAQAPQKLIRARRGEGSEIDILGPRKLTGAK
jgi:hypothetical protein